MTSTSLPPGWVRVSLGELLREPLRNGHSAKASGTDTGVRTLTLTAVTTGDFSEANTKLTVADPQFVSDLWLKSGDIFVERSNTPELVGTARLYRGPENFAIFPDLLIRVRLRQEVSEQYVGHFFQCPDARQYFRQAAQGIAGSMPKIDQGAVERLSIALAPRPEQDRIVAELEKQLTRLDAGVEALKRVQTQLKRYRASVLKAACEGRLVPTEAELARREKRDYEPADKLLERILKERRARWEADHLAKMKAAGRPPKDDKWKAKYEQPTPPSPAALPKLPAGWVWTTLRSIADLKGGITKGQKRSADERVTSVPYLRVANVQRGFLDLAEMKEIEATDEEIAELRLVHGDILFNEGGDRDKLGRGWIWQEQLHVCIHQNHVFRARLFSPDVEPKFVSHFANSLGQQYFIEQGKQTTNLASINLTKLGNLPVPLPPVEEQRRIVSEIDDRLSDADATMGVVSKNGRRAESLRRGVLGAAFAGLLVPQDSNDEPASKLLERAKQATAPLLPAPARGRVKRTNAAQAEKPSP